MFKKQTETAMPTKKKTKKGEQWKAVTKEVKKPATKKKPKAK